MNSGTVQRPSLLSGKASTAQSGSVAANPSQYFWLSASLSFIDDGGAEIYVGSVRRARQPRASLRFSSVKRAAMAFGDLPAQHQADARAAWFRREERHEQVRRV